MKDVIKEFKEFAMRGNVMDLAIGIIIGGAFGKVVTSLVSDVIMPVIGTIIGGVNFSNLVIVLKPINFTEFGEVLPAVTINYGLFINTIIDFVIVAFAIFMVIKAINRFKKKEEAKPKEEKQPTELDILKEIRDSLKK